MSDEQRRVSKVAYKDRRMKVHWHAPRFDEDGEIAAWDEYRIDCAEQPRPSFFDVLGEFRPWITDWLEIPAPQDERPWHFDVEIRGVSFCFSSEGDLGAVVSITKPLDRSTSPLNVNTPVKYERALSEAQAGCELAGGCVQALKRLHAEALAYADGWRAQLALPFGETDGKSAAAGDGAATTEAA